MLKKTAFVMATVVAAAVTAGMATAGGGTAMERSQAAGWNCFGALIGGYNHCAPPGTPSVNDLINGTDVPTLVLRVFTPAGDFAGIETLRRADLYSGQPCPQDNKTVWDGPIFGYYACHRFDT